MSATPNNVGPGYVVRLRVGGGGLTYTSRRMTEPEAESKAQGIQNYLDQLAVERFLAFDSDRGLVRVRTERVTAIEVCRTLLDTPYERTVPGELLETR